MPRAAAAPGEPSPSPAHRVWDVSATARVLYAVATLGLTTLLALAAWFSASAGEVLYRAVVPHTTGLPMIGVLADAATLGLLVGYGVVLWRSRRTVRVLALGLAAGAGVMVGYVASESVKLLLKEERPCRVVLPLEECPAVGDWSFPSNHMAIAAGLALAIWVLAPRSYRWGAALVVAVAVGRVGQGAHYPHDVLAGAVLGLGVVAVTVLAGAPAIAGLLTRMDGRPATLTPGPRPQHDDRPR
ncbi:hypothetical protein GCM10027273_07670 [Nocardioides pakistanensis]